ncbi:hypothetical protein MOQ_010100, partial [Trypanosoma cruzi marinkellei]
FSMQAEAKDGQSVLLYMSLPFCVWECCVRGCVRGVSVGGSESSPAHCGLHTLGGFLRHPGRGEEEDGEDLLWAEGGWMGQSLSVLFPLSLAVRTESIAFSNYGVKRLCRFARATQSSSLHAVVTARCGAVLFDEGRVRCHGCCAPQPFIASAPTFMFFCSHNIFFRFAMILLEEICSLCLLHGVLPCVSAAFLPPDAEAFDGVFTLFLRSVSQPCLVMAAAV